MVPRVLVFIYIGSSVSIVTTLRAGLLTNVFRFPAEVRDLCVLRNVQTGFCAQSSSKFNWYRGHFTRVKRRVCEVDHPSPSSAKFKNMWMCTSTPVYNFLTWCLTKHRDGNFYVLYE